MTKRTKVSSNYSQSPLTSFSMPPPVGVPVNGCRVSASQIFQNAGGNHSVAPNGISQHHTTVSNGDLFPLNGSRDDIANGSFSRQQSSHHHVQFTQHDYIPYPLQRDPSPEPPSSLEHEEAMLSNFDDEEMRNYENDVNCENDPEFQSYEQFGNAIGHDEDVEDISNNLPEHPSTTFDFSTFKSNDDLDILVDQIRTIKGIPSLYPWQQELLSIPTLREGGNMVYSVPTSGGKTLPAEIMMLHTVKNLKKSALLILPYVSLVNEKYDDFQDHSIDFPGLEVDAYFANRGILPPLEGERIMVATIEKSVSLMNSLVETNRLRELGLIVIDEFHLVGDPRGHHIEAILSKLMFLKQKGLPAPQILGMSATIPNLQNLSDWINGDLYESKFRPVELKEYVVLSHVDSQTKKSEQHVHEIQMNGERQFVRKLKTPQNPLFELIKETLADGDKSALVFCAKRVDTENLCKQLGKILAKSNPDQSQDFDEDIVKVLATSKITRDTLNHGIAYHHAGLHKDQREIVESLFKEKKIRILFCTSTLAAGVNLPAARVILNGISVGGQCLKKAQYMQMCGRAGRAGYDKEGESFLLPSKRDETAALKLIKQPLALLRSSFGADSVRKIIIECAVSFLDHVDDVNVLANSTLLSKLNQDIEGNHYLTYFQAALQDLKNYSFLKEKSAEELNAEIQQYPLTETQQSAQTNGSETQGVDTQQTVHTQNFGVPTVPTLYTLSAKGKAIAGSICSVKDAISIIEDLEKLQDSGLVLSNPLHVLYYLTPPTDPPIIFLNQQMWRRFYQMVEEAKANSPSMERIMELIGIDEHFVLSSSIEERYATKKANREKLLLHSRFYTACIIQDMIEEREVTRKYDLGQNVGKLDNLREQAAYHGSATFKLCEAMDWKALSAILKVYVPRIAEGCREDLLPLLEVEGIGQRRARLLHRIGIKTPEALAQAKSSLLRSKLGKKIVPKHMSPDAFIDKLIQNAKRLLQRKAREHRRLMEQMELSAETQRMYDTQG
eukprot:CAMPEP_0117455858 /NCGR_PEP_ID=MMETSP0759-20121206/11579_1 /TAXON_ID=63605 /ORGANISM="Percolomonas cosmopolitus, Strain WS" /LENGTH=1009 /DNA_ID=CAMNT_0005249181 /DNA_START=132 /DNA_END=3161 /DNA_ORIENTATION=+